MVVRNDQILPRQENATYEPLGCFTEGNGVRALGAASLVNYTTMTVEICAGFCTPTYILFGLEFGGECYCADVFGNGSVAAPATDCNFPCGGDANETCGAGNRLNVFSTTGTAPAPPAHVLTVGDYTRVGCVTEGNGTRALSDATEVDYSTTGMTVEKCAAFCSAGGFALMGVEFGGECYCGDETEYASSGSVAAPDSDCNILCAGDAEEFCGAGDRLDFYQANASAPTRL